MWHKVIICLTFFTIQSGIFEAQGNFTIEEGTENGQARWGTLPLFNISVYINTIFEPHNAIVHVSQNFLNFLMYTIFWVTAGGLYYKVNPIIGSRKEDDYYYEYYLITDDSNSSLYVNPTDLIDPGTASKSVAVAQRPDIPRRRREVAPYQKVERQKNPIKTLTSSLRAIAATVKSSAAFLNDLW